jgi:hypothetical protein
MKRAALYALDRLLVAAVAAGIVLAAQYAWHPRGATVATAGSAPAAYPVTVEASPSMTFDNSAALASFLVQTNNREWGFEAAFEQDLHRHDRTFHLTHEYIDGHKW